MLVVTAYTPDTYRAFLPRWTQTVKEHIGCNVVRVELMPMRWKKAAHAKPRVILSVLEEYKEDVLWLDVDAYVARRPPALAFDGAFAFRQAGPHSMTGTLFVSVDAVDYVRHWEKISEGANEPRNQLLFEQMVHEMRPPITYLAPGYCFVDYDDRDADVPASERYFVHHMHGKVKRAKERRG